MLWLWLFILFILGLFVLGQLLRDNSIADIGWGLGFILLALASLAEGGRFTERQLLVTLLVLLWGVRLTGHIALRRRGEDARYAAWRKQWRWVRTRAFFQVYMLQGALLLLIATPILLVMASNTRGLRWLDWLGAGVWLVGFAFEAVADWQLYHFKRQGRKGVLDTGVWRYSRHPNYFGEALLWWGVGLIALNVPYGWAGLVGPLTITILVRFVSGVPMLERSQMRKAAFRRYAERTPIFVPFWPKKKEEKD